MIGAPSHAAGPVAVANPIKALLWADEFDGAAGSYPDPTNWVYDVGAGGWGNSELEYYVNPNITPAFAHNIHIDGNSNLVIAAYKETAPDNTTQYTSARIKTMGLREFTPPFKAVARMQVPWTKALWPALWMLGHTSTPNYTSWPAEGEIDIGEWGLGGSCYAAGHLIGGKVGALSTQVNPGAFSVPHAASPVEWHVYGVDVFTDHATWHRDGQILGSISQAQFAAQNGDWTPFSGAWPFYILLNVAVGGTGGGVPDGTSVFPQTMLVDWVRVYSI